VRRLALAGLLAWSAAIFIVSSFPNPPDATGGEWQYEAAHVFEYAVFGALAFVVLRLYFAARPAVLLAVAAWLASVAYGISDEFHQSFVPNRDATWVDVVFDATGAAIGIAVAWYALWRWRTRNL
jgi:VanZ family protein